MTQGTLGLADHEFWTDPLRTRGAVERALLRAGEERVIFDMPARVVLEEGRTTLPAVVLRVAPNALGVDFPSHAVLAVSLVEERRTLTATLGPRPEAPAQAVLPRAGLPPPMGFVCQADVIDLRAHLDLPWEAPQTVDAVLLFRDRVLGRARVHVEQGPTAYRDAEVERLLAARAERPAPLPIWPPSSAAGLRTARTPAASYARDVDTPPVPEDFGIVLTTPRVITVGDGTRSLAGAPPEGPVLCPLRGSFRLPVRPRDLVPLESRPAAAASGSGRTATAVVPISLLLYGSEYAAPRVWRLAVPTHAPIGRVDDLLVATGCFTVELQSLVNLAGVPQTYWIHAFAGDVLGGPAVTAFTRVLTDR